METLLLIMLAFSPEWRQPSVGRPWALPLDATGGTAPYTFEVADGALPPGVYLVDLATVVMGSPSKMGLYGVPAEAGKWTVLLRVTDAAGVVAEKPLEICVSPLALTQQYVMAEAGQPLEWRTEVPEGVAPFEFALAESGYLPMGLTLASDGVLRGEAAVPGSYEVPVEVRDAAGNELKATLIVVVYGKETTLPPVPVKVSGAGCDARLDLPPLDGTVGLEVEWGDGARESAEAASVGHVYGVDGDLEITITATQRETGEQARSAYPLKTAGCVSEPQALEQ